MKYRSLHESWILFLFLWGSIASVAILLAVKYVHAGSLIFASRDMVIYGSLALLLPFARFSNRFIFLALLSLLYLVYLTGNHLFLNASYAAPLNNIRQILAPIALALAFYLLFSNAGGHLCGKRLSSFVYFLHLFIFLTGLAEYLTRFWQTFGLHTYFMAKGIPVNQHGLSYMFYEPLLGYSYRMTSTFLDPISLGHYFATMFSIAFLGLVYTGRKRAILLLSSLLGLLLCFSKGAFLQVFLTVILLNPRLPLLLRILSLALPVVAFEMVPNKSGLLIHINGFINSIETATLFGHGIGSSGNYTKMFSDDLTLYHQLGISDTYLGSILGQSGILGLFLWLFILMALYYRRGSRNLSLRFLAAIVMVSALSENTMNVTSFTLPALLITWLHFRYDRVQGARLRLAVAPASSPPDEPAAAPTDAQEKPK